MRERLELFLFFQVASFASLFAPGAGGKKMVKDHVLMERARAVEKAHRKIRYLRRSECKCAFCTVVRVERSA